MLGFDTAFHSVAGTFNYDHLGVVKKPIEDGGSNGAITVEDSRPLFEGFAIAAFVGRFSIETFIVATPPPAPAPLVFNDPPFPDASTNPTTNPVQLYHLGLWFNNPQDAFNTGRPNTVIPFNGEHNAGVQILDTSNFPDDFGPLRHITP